MNQKNLSTSPNVTDLGERLKEARAALPGHLQRSPLFASFVFFTNETDDVAQCQSTAIHRT